jgi:hypothetical protein
LHIRRQEFVLIRIGRHALAFARALRLPEDRRDTLRQIARRRACYRTG